MPLKFIGGIMAAIGMLMVLSHTVGLPKIGEEEVAMKRLFYGILLVVAGLVLIIYSPI